MENQAQDPQERNGSLVVPHFGILLYSSSFQLSLKKMTKSALSSNSKIVSKSRIRVAPVAASLSTSAPQLQIFYPRQDRKTPPLILLILKPSVHINSSIILTPYHNVLSHMARRFTTCVNERGKGQDTKGQTTHCPWAPGHLYSEKKGGKGTTLKCQVLSGLLLRLRQPHG